MSDYKILHKKSISGTPDSSIMSFGELAIRYGKDKETIFFKNDNEEIVSIDALPKLSDKYESITYPNGVKDVFNTLTSGQTIESGITTIEKNVVKLVEKTIDVTGFDNLTYSSNADAKYISGATSLADADEKLNDAINQVNERIDVLVNGSGNTDAIDTFNEIKNFLSDIDNSENFLDIVNSKLDGNKVYLWTWNGNISGSNDESINPNAFDNILNAEVIIIKNNLTLHIVEEKVVSPGALKLVLSYNEFDISDKTIKTYKFEFNKNSSANTTYNLTSQVITTVTNSDLENFVAVDMFDDEISGLTTQISELSNNTITAITVSGNETGATVTDGVADISLLLPSGGSSYDDTELRGLIANNLNSISTNASNIQKLSTNITTEATARKNADNELQEQINVLKNNSGNNSTQINVGDGLNINDNIISLNIGESNDNNKNYLVLEDNALAVRTINTDSTILQENITVAGLGSSGIGAYKDNDVIPAGTNIYTILQNILRKESYPTITRTTATASASMSNLTLTLDKSGDVEVGTKVTLTVGKTNGSSASDVTNSSISGMEYGFSAADDDTKDSSAKTISSTCTTAVSNNLYTISATINNGFGADTVTNKKTTPSTVTGTGSASLATTVLGCVEEGSNKITINATGASFSYNAAAINGVYYCSNLGNTDSTKFASGISAVNSITSKPTNSANATVTGKFYYFMGGSQLQEPSGLTSDAIRSLTKKAFLTKDGDTNVGTWTTPGYSVVIACPDKYELKEIKDTTFGFSYLENFRKTATIAVKTGEINTNYTVYMYPLQNDDKLDFKDIKFSKKS